MKKIFAFLLAAMMLLSFAACGDNNTTDPDKDPSGTSQNGGGSGNGGGSSLEKPGEDYDPYDPEQYIYKSVFANSPYKDQWDTSRSGAELDGIWDSAVLPDKIPEMPLSVTEVDRTAYAGKLDNKIGNNPPGSLSVDYGDDYDGEEKPWEYYMVMFTGTMDTFTTLVADFETNFACYDNRDDSMGETRFKGEFHAYSTDLYVFMSYQENGDYGDDYVFVGDGTIWFTIYAMPVHHQLPKVVEGVPLMQAGYRMWSDTYLLCYSEGDDDYTEIPYDYQTGTPTGTVKEYWGAEFEYYGATAADADAYGSQLISAGFTCTTDENEPYYKVYAKDDIRVVVQYDDEYKNVSVRVGTENWY